MSRARDERGSILVTVMIIGAVLAVVAGTLARGTFADLDQGQRSQATNRSLQAAEAGIGDYIAKLTQDHLYYAHRTHAAEATRVPAGGGAPIGKGQVWTGTLAWSYPNGADAWSDLGDGLEYDLRVYPPTAQQLAVRIVATGRRTGQPATAHTLEAFIRTASIVDYQMIADTGISYGAGATTEGKIYAAGNITHKGTIRADVFAEGTITTDSTTTKWQNGAKGWFNHPNFPDDIRTAPNLKNKVDFNRFTGSLGDVKLAAAAGGITKDTAGVVAWWLRFNADGTVTISTCAGTSTTILTTTTVPTCTGSPTTEAVPSNGAIYVGQPTIVSGTVKGRVTVGSPVAIAVGADIGPQTPGTDVIGLMGSDINVPVWSPTDLTWRAATLAYQGSWTSLGANNSKSLMIFTGSSATKGGGAMSQYATREYHYDDTLQYLQPPYFPVLEDAWTIQLLREIPNS